MANRWIALLGVAAAFACAPDEGTQQQADSATPPAAAVTMGPDTTGTALWSHLQDAGYKAWSLWPGKGEMYAGGEPHGMLLTTYLNDLATQALNAGSMTLPAGSIVVKENYMPDGMLAAITVMHKVPGYAPASGDWFWAKYTPDGGIDASGRVDGCIGCHGAAAAADYLLTARPQQ